MDQITHNVRRSNWLSIIEQCQSRPEGMTAKQWMTDNGISPKSYYYWLRKFRKESYELAGHSNDISFREIQFPILPQQDAVPGPVAGAGSSGNADAAVVISRGETVITITNSATAELAAVVVKELVARACHDHW